MTFNQKILAGAATLLVIVFGIGFARQYQRVQAQSEAAKVATTTENAQMVVVAAVAHKQLNAAVAITGTIRAAKEAVVLPKMPGRITRVTAELGQTVKSGEVLATVESYEFSLRVKQADAQASAARAGLDNAKVQHEQAERGLARAKALREKGSISAVDFEQAEVGAKMAAIGENASQAQLQLAETGLAMAQKAYDDTRVTAPFDGVVSKRMAQLGSEASPGQPLFVVQDQGSLKLDGTIPGSQLDRVQQGAAVSITVDELPGQVFKGTLANIAPTLDDTRRVFVEVTVAKAVGLLPYMFGSAEIAKGQEREVVTVPAKAVFSSADGALVYVVREGRAALVKPQLGARRGDDFVVEGGLAVGDQAVVSGDTGLKDGAKVTVVGG
jgi:membrane fusion protein, multidrug efflux system